MPSGCVVAPATVVPAMTVKLDIAALLDERPLGPLQARVLAFCFTILLIDGFDTQAIGYVAPALIHDMGIASATLGSLFTAGIVGMAIGSLGFGLAADRIGRRAALIGSLVVFGVFTLGKSLAQSFELLVGLQFLAGLGLGGAYPNAVALMAEYAPRRIRNTLVVVGACGYLLGSSVGGFIATWLIPLHGWQAVFQLGGVLPLVLSLVLAAALPDSLRFLASRNGRSAEARAILRRIAPGLDLAADAVLITPEHRPGGFPVAALFREGRAGMTLLLWLAHFMNLAVAFFTFSWLPTLFRSAGVSMQQSLLAATALPLGAVLGAIFWGWMIDRFRPPLMLALAALWYAIWLAPVGAVTHSVPLLTLLLFVAGIGSGSQTAVNAYTGLLYPTLIRSTGIGWAIGVGRIGSILGPAMGAAMIAGQWSLPAMFHAAALPLLVAAAALYAIGFSRPLRGTEGRAPPAVPGPAAHGGAG